MHYVHLPTMIESPTPPFVHPTMLDEVDYEVNIPLLQRLLMLLIWEVYKMIGQHNTSCCGVDFVADKHVELSIEALLDLKPRLWYGLLRNVRG